MIKPNGYDEVKASGFYEPVEVGGHTCVIYEVTETQSKTGKDMIVVKFDFDSSDAQKEYFANSYRNDERDDRKWPYQGTKYIMVNDYKDTTKTSKDFKTFCSCVERSNPGFNISWGDNWGDQFKRKKIGAVYGLVENEYNDEITTRAEIRWFCEYSKAFSAKTPDTKYLKKKAQEQTFTVLTDEDTDLPF